MVQLATQQAKPSIYWKKIFMNKSSQEMDPDLASKILWSDAAGLLFLGILKSIVYVDKPQSFDALEAKITRVINGIPADMLERVLENWIYKMDHVRASCGQHLNEIIFKY